MLTTWGLKPDKQSGEQSMIFDLSVHPAPVTVQLLNNNFTDYLDGMKYNEEKQFWENTKTGVFFPHDEDCGKNDLEKIKNRLTHRIKILQKF